MENVEIKTKPWGREVWFGHTDRYAGKILEVKKGHRLSLQIHKQKMETQYVYSGRIKLWVGSEENDLKEVILEPGQKYDIMPGTIHRVEALEDSEIFEVSTPELNDITKLADDYGRVGSGNNESLDQSLHAQNFSS